MQHDFLRYGCQVVLPGFGLQSQLKLQQAKVLVVGAGGLGCPATQYLAAAGIGTLGIADFDVVSLSNLHRQILYTPAEVGLKKAVVACAKLAQQNPQIAMVVHDVKITPTNVFTVIGTYDIVVDCTDNFETRYLLNDACVLHGKPVVYGAIYQHEGQVAVWNVVNPDGTRTPNYRDVYPDVNAAQIPNCAEGGVLPTIAGIIGCMQANEVIKYITDTGQLLAGKILLFDAQTMQSRVIKTGTVSKTNIIEVTETDTIYTVTAAELRKGIDNGKYWLVDVRTFEEREAFNIGGWHVPLHTFTDNTAFDFNASKPIVFYCATGRRSAEAVKLAKTKFPQYQCFSLAGGLKAWIER